MDNDLEFKIGIGSDIDKIESMLVGIGELADSISEGSMAQLSKDLKLQAQSLAQINALMSATSVMNRIKAEKDLVDVRKKMLDIEKQQGLDANSRLDRTVNIDVITTGLDSLTKALNSIQETDAPIIVRLQAVQEAKDILDSLRDQTIHIKVVTDALDHIRAELDKALGAPIVVPVKEVGLQEVVAQIAAIENPEVNILTELQGIQNVQDTLDEINGPEVTVDARVKGVESIRSQLDSIKDRAIDVSISDSIIEAQKILKSIDPQQTITVDTEGVVQLKRAMQEVRDKTLKVTIESNLGALQKNLEQLSPTIDIQTRITGLAYVKTKLEDIQDKSVSVNVASSLDMVKTQLDQLVKSGEVDVSIVSSGVDNIKSTLATIEGVEVPVDAKLSGIASIEAELSSIKPLNIDVTAEIKAASTAIASLKDDILTNVVVNTDAAVKAVDSIKVKSLDLAASIDLSKIQDKLSSLKGTAQVDARLEGLEELLVKVDSIHTKLGVQLEPDLNGLSAKLNQLRPTIDVKLAATESPTVSIDTTSALDKLKALREAMAAAAQEEYDAWDQSGEYGDEEVGGGGICDLIADKIASVLSDKLENVDFREGGQDGDDHAYNYVRVGDEAFGVDIPPQVYETGGGYNWKKKPDVKFEPEDVDIWPIPIQDVFPEYEKPEPQKVQVEAESNVQQVVAEAKEALAKLLHTKITIDVTQTGVQKVIGELASIKDKMVKAEVVGTVRYDTVEPADPVVEPIVGTVSYLQEPIKTPVVDEVRVPVVAEQPNDITHKVSPEVESPQLPNVEAKPTTIPVVMGEVPSLTVPPSEYTVKPDVKQPAITPLEEIRVGVVTEDVEAPRIPTVEPLTVPVITQNAVAPKLPGKVEGVNVPVTTGEVKPPKVPSVTIPVDVAPTPDVVAPIVEAAVVPVVLEDVPRVPTLEAPTVVLPVSLENTPDLVTPEPKPVTIPVVVDKVPPLNIPDTTYKVNPVVKQPDIEIPTAVVNVSSNISKAIATLQSLQSPELSIKVVLEGVDVVNEILNAIKAAPVTVGVSTDIQHIQNSLNSLYSDGVSVEVRQEGTQEIISQLENIKDKTVKIIAEAPQATIPVTVADTPVLESPTPVPYEVIPTVEQPSLPELESKTYEVIPKVVTPEIKLPDTKLEVVADVTKAQSILQKIQAPGLTSQFIVEGVEQAKSLMAKVKANPITVELQTDLTKVEGLLNKLVVPRVVDVATVESGVQDIQDKLANLGVEAKANVVAEGVDKAIEEVSGIQGKSVKIGVVLDGIESIRKQLADITDLTVNVQLKSNIADIQSRLDLVATTITVDVLADGLEDVAAQLSELTDPSLSVDVSKEQLDELVDRLESLKPESVRVDVESDLTSIIAQIKAVGDLVVGPQIETPSVDAPKVAPVTIQASVELGNVKESIDNLLGSLPRIDLNVESSLDKVRDELENLKDYSITVPILTNDDIQTVMMKLEGLKAPELSIHAKIEGMKDIAAELGSISDRSIDVDVKDNVEAVVSRINSITKLLKIDVEVDDTTLLAASEGIAGIQDRLNKLTTYTVGVRAEGVDKVIKTLEAISAPQVILETKLDGIRLAQQELDDLKGGTVNVEVQSDIEKVQKSLDQLSKTIQLNVVTQGLEQVSKLLDVSGEANLRVDTGKLEQARELVKSLSDLDITAEVKADLQELTSSLDTITAPELVVKPVLESVPTLEVESVEAEVSAPEITVKPVVEDTEVKPKVTVPEVKIKPDLDIADAKAKIADLIAQLRGLSAKVATDVEVKPKGLQEFEDNLSSLRAETLTIPVVNKGLADVQLDLFALTAPNLTVEAKLNGYQTIYEKLAAIKDKTVDIDVTAELSSLQKQLRTLVPDINLKPVTQVVKVVKEGYEEELAEPEASKPKKKKAEEEDDVEEGYSTDPLISLKRKVSYLETPVDLDGLKEQVRLELEIARLSKQRNDLLEEERLTQYVVVRGVDAQKDVQRSLNREILAQADGIARVRAAMDPDVIKVRLNLQKEELELSKQLADAQLMQRIPLTEIEAYRDANRDNLKTSMEQADALVRVRALQNPDLIMQQLNLERQRLETQKEALKVKSQTSLDVETIKMGLDLQKEEVELAKKIADVQLQQRIPLTEAEAYRDAMREAARASVEQADALTKAKAMLNPEVIAESRKRAETDAEIKKYQTKANRERERPGFFQKIFSNPVAALGDVKKNVGTFVKDTKEEYKAGGIGGIIDKFVSNKGDDSNIGMMLGAIRGGQPGGAFGAAGGMIGMALGGPVGAEVGKMVGEVVQAGLAMPGKMIVGMLNTVSKSLSGLAGPLGPLGVGFDLLGDSMEGALAFVGKFGIVGEAINSVLGPLAAIPGTMKGILETLTGFAGKASPGQYRMLQIALEDVQAVIGGSFVPIMEIMKDSIRLIGDVIANLLPNAGEMYSALGEIRVAFAEVRAAVMGAMTTLGPTVRGLFISVVKEIVTMVAALMRVFAMLVPVLTPVIDVMATMAKIFVDIGGVGFTVGFMLGTLAVALAALVAPLLMVLGPILLLASPFIAVGVAIAGVVGLLRSFGVIGPAATGARTSDGAAARPAQFSGFEEYQRQIQVSAYSDPGVATQAQVPTILSDIRTTLNQIYTWLTRPLDAAANAFVADPNGVGMAVGMGLNNAASGVRNAAARFGINLPNF